MGVVARTVLSCLPEACDGSSGTYCFVLFARGVRWE
jgi:hypothetical protein